MIVSDEAGRGVRESRRIAMALIASAVGAVTPDVVNVRCNRAVLSEGWMGSWFIGRRK